MIASALRLKVEGELCLARGRSIPIPYDSVECRVAFRPEPGARFETALSELYRIYRHLLYAYMRRRGRAPDNVR